MILTLVEIVFLPTGALRARLFATTTTTAEFGSETRELVHCEIRVRSKSRDLKN